MKFLLRPVMVLILVLVMAASATVPSNSRHASPIVSFTPLFFKSPLAAFSYNPCTLCMVPGDLIFFNANGSLAIGHSIVLFTWNFGDGSAVLQTTSPYVNHDYFGYPGKWTVTLTVSTDDSASDTLSQLVVFNVAPSFTFHPRVPIVDRPVTFNASSSKSYGPIVGEFLWGFGDGSTGSGIVVTHAYSMPGAHRVNMTMTTSVGSPTISKAFFVWKSPDVNNDGSVGVDDLIDVWVHQFTNDTRSDLDGDGTCDTTDLIFVYLSQFQTM